MLGAHMMYYFTYFIFLNILQLRTTIQSSPAEIWKY